MSTLVIYNPISGAGRALQSATNLERAAADAGLEVVLMPTRAEPPAAWLREPLASHDRLVVVGGDGAVRAAAAEAAHADVPLVHLPAGNENLFAREFEMTDDVDEVVRRLRDGVVQRVDLASAAADGGPAETMVLMASVGFDADVVHDLASKRRGPVRHFSYLLPAIRSFLRFAPAAVHAMVDDIAVPEVGPAIVMIANSRQYACRLDPAARARMDDGRLDLLILPCRGRFGLLRWMFTIFRRRQLEAPRAVYREGRRFRIDFDQPVHWQVDGDPPHHSSVVRRLEIEIESGVLPVLVHPRTA
ncbi:MAG: diacylglycerol kinase family protein [Phycisphaerales bacterium]|nr:diacylglycerol kinase family protein [Phycisphaerales bacterium]